MKKVLVLIFSFITLLTMVGCGGNDVKKIINEYYSEKLYDANDYSINIKSKTDITKKNDDYYDIIDYVSKEFDCKENDIKSLQEIIVEVQTDYGYKEEYTDFFIVGRINGVLKILDKVDGPWNTGHYAYGGEVDGGGYSASF